jgi:hypothetical protein
MFRLIWKDASKNEAVSVMWVGKARLRAGAVEISSFAAP